MLALPPAEPRARTVINPDPFAGVVMDFDTFLEAHFRTPDGRLLPIEEPWRFDFQTVNSKTMKCEACNGYSRGRDFYRLTHRRVEGAIYACRLCFTKLYLYDKEKVEAEQALPWYGEGRIWRDYFERFRNARLITDTNNAKLQITPRDGALVQIQPFKAGWAWRITVDESVEYGETETLEECIADAFAEWQSIERLLKIEANKKAEDNHALACEVAGLASLEEMCGDHLVVW